MQLSPANRRALIKTMGLGATAGMFPSLWSRPARAAVAPKRFVVFYSYHGTQTGSWRPKSGNETSFELNGLMQPYAAYKNDLILLDGVDSASHRKFGGIGNAHQQGHLQALSSTKQQSDSLAGGITIDQAIAQGMNAKTRFPSLELGLNDNAGFPDYHFISHTGAGQKLASEADPRKVWSRVFKDFMPQGGGVVDDSALRLKARQKGILDYVKNEVDLQAKRMSTEDRLKLQAHMQAVRDLEVRLALDDTAPDKPVGLSCVTPANPNPTGSGKAWFDKAADFQTQLIAMALACDLTRVASLNVEELSGSVCGIGDPHSLAHDTSPDNGGRRGDTGAVAQSVGYHLIYNQVFGKLLSALANIPDVDGKRVLDNTVVLWAGEIALGSHATDDYHWLLAGSAGGALKTGRWLKFDPKPNPLFNGAGTRPTHGELFVSIANAVGVPMTKFGAAEICRGPMERL